MNIHNHNNKKKNQRISLMTYIKKNKNVLIVSVVGFVLGGMIWGIVEGLIKDSLKERWANRNPGIDLKILNSSLGVFQDDGFEKVIQILSYEVSVLDFTTDIKITSTFNKSIQVTKCYITYSVDMRGFEATQLPSNHVELKLKHPLDISKKAYVYLWTEKKFISGDDEKVELPNIHIEGKAKNEKVIYK